jgi:excisionase family DNA binding protein
MKKIAYGIDGTSALSRYLTVTEKYSAGMAASRVRTRRRVLVSRGSEFDAIYWFLKQQHGGRPCLVDGDGRTTEFPTEMFEVLMGVAQAMKHGKAVTIMLVSMTLTTSQAADMIGVSRQTLVRLLERGEIPFEQPSRHRRIRLSDVLDYQSRLAADRRSSLNEMARMALEDGLYEDSADDYAAAFDASDGE